MTTEDRLAALESRLEFQDETITALNDEIVRQQQRLTELEKSLEIVVERMRERSDIAEPAPEPPPPHY